MEAVADIFDRDRDGYIDYKEFVAALRPDREVRAHARASARMREILEVPLRNGEQSLPVWSVNRHEAVARRSVTVHSLTAPCLLALCLTAPCLTALCLTAPCLVALCLTAPCLMALCLTAPCLMALCLTAPCLMALCLTAPCLVTLCLTALIG